MRWQTPCATVTFARAWTCSRWNRRPPPASSRTPSSCSRTSTALTTSSARRRRRGMQPRLKPGSFVINPAGGEVVDADAMANAVRDRNIRAGLDVFTLEPATATGEFKDPIVLLPNVYGTHHIGGSTAQAQEAIAAEAVRVI